MKKFLSVLLALAVAFTFTFGSTMSAFAYDYDKADAAKVLDSAYAGATAKAVKIDYDGLASDTDANAITVYEISATAIQAAIYEYYQAEKLAVATASDIAGVNKDELTGVEKHDVALVRASLEDAFSNANYAKYAYEAAFDGYKTVLTAAVSAINTDTYTTTNYKDLGMESGFVAKDGNTYDTSREAANADKQWALDAIAKAKFVTSGEVSNAASAITEWKTNSYTDMYEKIFNEVFTMVMNRDDVVDTNKVTSVSYKMKRAYSTEAAEKQASATLAVQKAQAKAELASVITTYEVGSNYKAAYANSVAAYNEAITYLIDSALVVGEIPTIAAINASTTDATHVNGVDYIALSAYAAQAKADAASNKQVATIQGKYYDDAKADEKLVEVLRSIYTDHAYDSATQKTTEGKELYAAIAAVTDGEKAAYKKARDYSEVLPDDNGIYTFKTYNTGTLANATYYAKEWEAVKAAVDAYCAAIDAAKTDLDVENAEKAYKAATAEKLIAKSGTVDLIFLNPVYQNGMLAAYWDKVANGATIYVTWDGGVSYKSGYSDNDFIAYAIAKGARSAKEADALYADACALIDAYKTKAQLTTEATAVQSMIAALPKTVALADKDAVIAAYDAYTALAEQFRGFVANASTLKADVAAIEKLEAAEVIKMINALPPTSKITVADKAAVKAASDARKAWDKEDAYKDTTMVPSRTSVPAVTAYETAVKNAELKAINDAYTPLLAKYSVDALTAEDAAAVKALKEAVDAYIAEYKEALACEATLAKMLAVVDVATEWTTTDVKAALFDMNRALSIWKTSKTSLKVTVKGDVSDIKANGYTVKYTFYKKAPGAKSYKAVKTTTSKTYKYTNLKKGTNKFQVKVKVYDKDGKLVATKMTYYRSIKVK